MIKTVQTEEDAKEITQFTSILGWCLYFNDFYLICLRTFSSKQTPELSVVYILAPGSDLIVPLVISAERMLSVDPVAENGPARLVDAVACVVRAGAVGVAPDGAVNMAYPPRSMLPAPPVAEPGLPCIAGVAICVAICVFFSQSLRVYIHSFRTLAVVELCPAVDAKQTTTNCSHIQCGSARCRRPGRPLAKSTSQPLPPPSSQVQSPSDR